MDTKWKRFKRSYFTKTVCFLLAILVMTLGVARFFDFAKKVDQDDSLYGWEYYDNILSQGNKFDLEASEPFKSAYKSFIAAAYRDALVYGDGSKKAYEDYQEKYAQFISSAVDVSVETILKNITEESGEGNYYHSFYYEDYGLATLTKIEDTKHKQSGDCFVYNDGSYYYGSPDEYDYDYHYYDDLYDDDDIDFYDPDVTVPYTTVVYGGALPDSSSYETTRMPVTSYNGEYEIPESVMKKASGSDGVVEITRAYKNGKEYSGYYAIKVDRKAAEEKLLREHYHGEIFEGFSDYAQFTAAKKDNDDILSQYKNLHYAFYFGDEHRFVSNVKKLSADSSKNEVQKYFTSYSEDWGYIKDYENNKLTLFEEAEEISKGNSTGTYRELVSTHFFETEIGDAYGIFGKDLTVYVVLDPDLTAEDAIWDMPNQYYRVYEYVSDAFRFVLIMLLLFILLTVYLVCQTGRKGRDDEVHLAFTDRIFTSVRIAINGGLLFLCGIGYVIVIEEYFYDAHYAPYLMKMCIYALTVATTAVLLDLILYIARLLKARSFFRNFILGRIISGSISARRKAKERRKEKEERPKKEKPVIYKDIFKDVLVKLLLFIFAPNVFMAFWLIFFAACEEWGLFWLLLIPLYTYDMAMLFFMGRYAYYLKTVLKALNEIRGGNYDVWVETQGMPKAIMAYAEDVNAIRNGFKIAVDNAIKEEKTKTELITNVSHDLKTPLTSIITYVDLLSRCDISDETAREYLEVLGEKSLRLKRLIEDLVEASKASTGNMNVSLVKLSLNELIMQIAAEYEDEFASKGLRLIMDGTGLNLTVLCDSKMSYRILDNLMNNIRKYAMPNTRVYLDIRKEENKAVVTLRNISENQLNISAKELMERFVRGDSSRSTEGNGLGLSIAENLAVLQGGKLTVEISGDLFTATVEFLIE